MSYRILLAAYACLSVAAPGLFGNDNLLHELTIERVTGGLRTPTAVAQPADDSGRFFFTEQPGRIVIFDGSMVLGDSFLDISDRVSCCGERGLLGLAFHPRYAENGMFYLYYTDSDEASVLSRMEVSANNPDRADPSTETVLFKLPQPSPSHQGGQLLFGPDGYLYISLGDGGADWFEAQDKATLYGSILRIDVDDGEPYAIPPDNPFVDDADARGEIWVMGLRNPWRFTFDRDTGDMFIGDVGHLRAEEINFKPAASPGGENYGWGFMEGTLCLEQPVECVPSRYVPPIIEYRRTEQDCASVIAGYRYSGVEYPQMRGVFFFADHCLEGGQLRAARQDENGQWTDLGARNIPHYVSSFGEGPEGELYYVDHAGALYRITAEPPTAEISVLSPPNAVAGGQGFTLTMAGSNFVPASEIRWNGRRLDTRFLDNGRLQATIPADELTTPRTVQLSVLNRETGASSSAVVPFEVVAAPDEAPAINEGGIVEGASFRTEVGLSPGGIASVFGLGLATETQEAPVMPLPRMLGGVTIRFGGEHDAPLFAATAQQTNIQIPWEMEGASEADLQALLGPHVSDARTVALSDVSPGIFSMDRNGAGQGAILIAGTGGILAAPQSQTSRPIRRGEFMEIFCTGLGPVENRPRTGEPASLEDLSPTVNEVTAMIGGAPATIAFAGLAPGLVGLYQVTAETPEEAQGGPAVEVSLTVKGVRSNVVTAAVRERD